MAKPKPESPLSMTSEKAASAARQATEEGRRVFACVLASPALGPVDNWPQLAPTIEAVEDAGWRLDSLNFYFSTVGLNHPVAVLVFRRIEA